MVRMSWTGWSGKSAGVAGEAERACARIRTGRWLPYPWKGCNRRSQPRCRSRLPTVTFLTFSRRAAQCGRSRGTRRSPGRSTERGEGARESTRWPAGVWESDGAGHLQPGAVGIVLDDDPAVAGVLEAQRVVDGAGTGVVGPDVQGDRVGAVLLRPLENRLGEQERDALLAGPGGDPHGLQLTLVLGG